MVIPSRRVASLWRRAFAAAVVLCAPGVLHAQKALIAGVVSDSLSARPLSGAAVSIVAGPTQWNTRSDETGAFRFFEMNPGRYALTIRRLGYQPWLADVEVSEKGATVTVRMRKVASLDTVRVTAGTAIYGVVGKYVDLTPVAGAQIQIIGVRESLTTDSAGHFFAPIDKPGVYVVRVRKNGFQNYTMSVTVRKDDPVELAMLLAPASRPSSNGYEYAWSEFANRVALRGTRSALVSRAELSSTGSLDVFGALQRVPSVTRTGLRFGASVCVFVNGMASGATPIWKLDVEEIEAVEVYAADRQSELTGTLADKTQPLGCTPTGLPPTTASAKTLIRWVVLWLRT